MPEFPPEIISAILSRLPVKSLLRFRCTSKPLCSLIDDPHFIKLHLNLSQQTNSHRSLVLRECYLYSVDLDSLDQAVELDHPLKTPAIGTELTEVLGSCNGLLLLSNSEEDSVLWNMSTRKHFKLPVTEIEFPEYLTFSQYIVYGFGYDSITDDYKVVRIIQFPGIGYDSFDSEVKVYSLKSNSWRRISDFPYYLRYKRVWGQFVGGALHWVVSRRPESYFEDLIVAVDLGVEEYRVVPKPEGLEGDFHMNLWVFEGCLCMICNYYIIRVDIWVMRDYGVRESWTKLLSIGQPEVIRSFEFVLPLVQSGDRVLLNQDGVKLVWYDLEMNRIKKVRVHGIPTMVCDMEIYQDSLVRPNGDNEVVEIRQPDRRKKKKKRRRDNVESDGYKLVLNNSVEVVVDILSRLPVKTLLRLKCVCKTWCTMIDDSDFIKRHLKTSIESNTNLSLVLRDSYIYSADLYSLDKVVELDHPLKSPYCGTDVLGSCNGLLCLYNSEEDIVLWNLSTRKYQKLPIAPIKSPDYFTFCQYIIYGFGYDTTSDDYKVVRVVQFYGEDSDSFDNEVKMYSLKTNSWRRIKKFPYYLRYKRGWGMFASGALHWVVTQRPDSNTSNLIFAFDLGAERYQEVPQPNYLDKNFHMNLAVLGGNLCILCNYHKVRVDIWVMKEYGVKESWTRLCSITQPKVIRSFEYVRPLAYSKTGNEVLLEQDNKKLIWYDLKRNKVKIAKVPGMPDSFDADICVGSLVSLGGHDGTVGKQQEARSRKGKKRDDFLSVGFKLVL